MKLLLLFLLVFCFSTLQGQIIVQGIPVEEPDSILKNSRNFIEYIYKNVKLSEDFIACNSNDSIISKDDFLQNLLTGNYLPLCLKQKDSFFLKLYKIDSPIEEELRIWIKTMAYEEYKYSKMKGTRLPKFYFKDLDGNIYDSITTKGKIVVLKFWFIHCLKCVEEMPSLNELVKQYKNQKDVLFISLAFDKEEELKRFLKKKNFKYAVVANQLNYLSNDLKITSYPIHIIINREGLIVKMVGSYEELESALKKEMLK